MQSVILLCFTAVVACAYAQVSLPPGYAERYPNHYFTKSVRHPRDVTWDFHRNVGNGQVFGALGNDDGALYGRGGYKQDIFNDHRGQLTGQAYGSRTLSDYGDSSRLGGRLDWADDNAKAALDIHKEIGRGSGMTLSGDGVWKLDKNTRLSAGGRVQKTFGHERPDVALEAEIRHDF